MLCCKYIIVLFLTFLSPFSQLANYSIITTVAEKEFRIHNCIQTPNTTMLYKSMCDSSPEALELYGLHVLYEEEEKKNINDELLS